MKTLIIFLFLCLANTSGFSQDYSAATYNVRLNIESDGINKWENRKEWLANQVDSLSPDILGTQEGLHDQVIYLDSALSSYNYVGIGRKDGVHKGEYAAIFYDTHTFESLSQGTFWLSESPDSVSKGWDAAYIRICTYALLFDAEDNAHIWVFNTHLDNEGEQSRLESLKLIQKYIRQLNTENYPVLLMGDLNATPDSKPIQYLSSEMKDSKSVSQTPPAGPEGTYNGFNASHPLDRRIDYIFVNNLIKVLRYEVINEIKHNRTPSDHLPVFIHFNLLY